jgi:methyl-accepting chemotaxis protein
MFCNACRKQNRALEKNLSQKTQVLDALNRVSAVIEFALDGTILWANENFLNTTGYALSEVVERSHRMFLDKKDADSSDYKRFWQKLNQGEFVSGRFKRRRKDGSLVWLEASYTPVMGESGHPLKVIKFATDVTSQVEKALDDKAQIDAIHQVMAVIAFEPDGTIMEANAHFLQTMGYDQNEIVGKHHRMFTTAEHAASDAYQAFWQRLRAGNAESGTFKRYDKQGREVWLEASYNPIFDSEGQLVKVVKYATDIGSNPNTRLLDRVVKDAKNVICAIANGKLDAHMVDHLEADKPSMFDKNIASLQEGVNTMVLKLQEVIGEVKDSTELFLQKSEDVSSDAAQLTERVQVQARSVKNMADGMQEISQSVDANANAAESTAQSALHVQDQVSQGVTRMNQTLEAIKAIQASSQKITEIIALIDGIAFQTNLLALNAAVEAARAGEHGRGFAVVAGEVRALSQKSSEAAKDIRNLIEESGTRVDHGVNLANQSGELLQEISGVVHQVTDKINHIAQTSGDQSERIHTIDASFQELDQLTQQNAQQVSETAKAAQDIHMQADQLEQDVGFFTMNGAATKKLS